MSYLSDNYSSVDCDKEGNVYRNGLLLKPFHSNRYLQVIIFDDCGKKKTCGVHTIVAMKYLDYFDGCVVHHKDHNRQNNRVENLEVYDRKSHCRFHCQESDKFTKSRKGKIPWNKGMKMSDEFREHCRQSALSRKAK